MITFEKLKDALMLIALCTCLIALIAISSSVTYYAVAGPPKEVTERLQRAQVCNNMEVSRATKN